MLFPGLKVAGPEWELGAMSITAEEQYLIELINRARLDPRGEADRYLGGNLDLNNSGSPLGTQSRQPLAGNDALHNASANHSLHMLDVDQFEHSGIGDGTPRTRMESAGYVLSGSWGTGENISAYSGSNAAALIEQQHAGLFVSVGHRYNILNDSYRELGIGQEMGYFSGYSSPGNWYSSLLTENFAYSGNRVFVTGAVYNDSNGNDFYSIGEGVSGRSVTVGGIGSDTSAAAGGYEINVSGSTGQRTVTSGSMSVQIELGGSNVKLDFIGANEVASSANTTIVSGVSELRLLGVEDLTATGGSASESLIGNSGNNLLFGSAGADNLNGGAGIDTADFSGATNNQKLNLVTNANIGGFAHGDTLTSIENVIGSATRGDDITGTIANNILTGLGADDILRGYYGNDTLNGNTGNDFLFGGSGADNLNGGSGLDWAMYSGLTTGITVNLLTGIGSGGQAEGDIYNSIERARGTSANDQLFGDNGNNRLLGDGGDDELRGLQGRDDLRGGGGNDILNGGWGNDAMRGDGGSDTFRYYLGADHDFIVDFTDNVDTIELDNALWTGNLNAQQVVDTYMAMQNPNRFYFDFGGGDVLHVLSESGLNLSDFYDDIVIV